MFSVYDLLMAAVTSAQNPLIREARKAVRRGTLTSGGCVVAEGFHLIEEAVRSGCGIEAVFCAAGAVAEAVKLMGENGARIVEVDEKVLRSLSAAETAQGAIALVRPPRWTLDEVFAGRTLVVALDGMQDPGNAGAIVRAAEAFGATGVVALTGTVNLYNPKALRASAGSTFRVPLAGSVTEEVFLEAVFRHSARLFAAMPRAAMAPADCPLAGRCAIAIGSEAHGVRSGILEHAAGVSVPTEGVESLNAAMAAGILLYEARRQRRETA